MSNTKDIKDYLHLYLGCECYIIYKNADVVRGRITVQNLYDMELTGGFSYHIETMKPFLSKISDITKDEGYELCQLMQWGIGASKMNDIINYGVSGVDIKIQEQAQFFKILLSKGFDLFGLIEAGLAIDKTKKQIL